ASLDLHSFPTRRSSDLVAPGDLLAVGADVGAAPLELEVKDLVAVGLDGEDGVLEPHAAVDGRHEPLAVGRPVQRIQVVQLVVDRSEEHTSELQSLTNIV